MVTGEESADIVIIGSGFGGAVSACRLASPDRSVVVLERGRDWSETKTPQRFRDYLYSSRVPHWLNGWLDIRFLDQMVVATGAGIGGGSLIYANVCVDAPDLVFRSGWPSQITADEMRRYYCKVAKVLRPQTIPETQFNPRMAMLSRAAAEIGAGARYRPLPLAVAFDDTVSDTRGEPWLGEVFDYHNLFVMDGSVIPRAIGRNPSKTIAAIAERSCEKLLEELPARLNGAAT